MSCLEPFRIFCLTRAFGLAIRSALATSIAAAGACTFSLDGDSDGNGDASPAVATGCLPFERVDSIVGLAGDLHSIAQPDGTSLWVAEQVTAADVSRVAGVFVVADGEGADCGAWSAKFVDTIGPPPLAPSERHLSPLDLVSTPAGLALYYRLDAVDATGPFGRRTVGFGLAPRDAATGRFQPTSELLWSADRPNYGASVLLSDGMAYVFGCRSGAPLISDCFVARADPSRLASSAAYTYWTGQTWSASADDAAPVTRGGSVVSVRKHPSRAVANLMMTYVSPLGRTLLGRSGVAPQGPWSAPVALAECDLADARSDLFCSGGQQHPELAGAPPQMVMTYEARSLVNAGDGSPRTFWPRLVALDAPKELP